MDSREKLVMNFYLKKRKWLSYPLKQCPDTYVPKALLKIYIQATLHSFYYVTWVLQSWMTVRTLSSARQLDIGSVAQERSLGSETQTWSNELSHINWVDKAYSARMGWLRRGPMTKPPRKYQYFQKGWRTVFPDFKHIGAPKENSICMAHCR